MINIVLILLVTLTIQINAHGRLMKPPNRSSIWRVAEFESQNPPTNSIDNQLFCGGVYQDQVVGGNCGVCGDPITEDAPRANEIGGYFYRGIITGRYTAGQIIDIEVELTTSHIGYMEWRLCTTPLSGGETQDCFNRHVLQLANGSGTKVNVTSYGLYSTQLRLPLGVTCSHCVIQWNYRAGNSVGDCGDGTSQFGCGPQDTYRGCSDIVIQ